MTIMQQRILIIRLSALGDLVLCFAAFQAIRTAHPDARIALLTTPAFAGFAGLMPWFDEVLIDDRAPLHNLPAWWRLTSTIRKFRPDRVYDLQGKQRQTYLYYALGGPVWGPEWSGAAPGCSHPRLWPPQPEMHFTDFLAAQLQRAGIANGTKPNLDWLDADVSSLVPQELADSLPPEGLGRMTTKGEGGAPQSHNYTIKYRTALPLPHPLPQGEGSKVGIAAPKFVLLIPGCAPQHFHKRWPAENYAALANHLHDQGYAVLAVGTKQDADAIAAIRQTAPQVIDLGGQTSLRELAGLARRAAYVIGNDTGPTHLAAAVGSPTLALLSDRVNPVWSVPKGPKVSWLQGRPLASLALSEVIQQLRRL